MQNYDHGHNLLYTWYNKYRTIFNTIQNPYRSEWLYSTAFLLKKKYFCYILSIVLSINQNFMSKTCVFCGKGGLKRNNGRHTSHNRKSTFANRGPQGMKAVVTSSTIKPNFREVRIEKGMEKVTSCMRCYKSLKSTALESLALK